MNLLFVTKAVGHINHVFGLYAGSQSKIMLYSFIVVIIIIVATHPSRPTIFLENNQFKVNGTQLLHITLLFRKYIMLLFQKVVML